MPELAFILSIGVLLCWVSTGCVTFMEKKRHQLFQDSYLQKNLMKVKKRWNSLNQNLEINESNESQRELRSIQTTIYIFGFGLGLLSWIGLFLFWITYGSIRIFGHSRPEKNFIMSALNQSDLSIDQIEKILKDLT